MAFAVAVTAIPDKVPPGVEIDNSKVEDGTYPLPALTMVSWST